MYIYTHTPTHPHTHTPTHPHPHPHPHPPTLPQVPRVLINREPVGCADNLTGGFWFHDPRHNYRDVFLQGNCDDAVLALVRQVALQSPVVPLLLPVVTRDCQRRREIGLLPLDHLRSR